jgi:hypothetical protein
MSEIFVVGHPTLLAAAERVSSCEKCDPAAGVQFGLIITFVKDLNPKETLFCQTEPVPCPNPECGEPIWEHTLISF